MIATIAQASDLSVQQLAAIMHRGGNVLVEGAPGSGKTRLIVERCRMLLAAGVPASAVLVLTTQSTADELHSRILGALPDTALPAISTFMEFAAWLTAASGSSSERRFLALPAERTLFAHAAAFTSMTSLPPGSASSPHFLEVAGAHVEVLRRAPEDTRRALATHATPRIRDLLALDAGRADWWERLNVTDGTDLVTRAVALLSRPHPAPARIVLQRFKHILLDEFQDADRLQTVLLEYFGGEIFAVGDANPSIYRSRGASSALADVCSALSMKVLRLERSFRCPPDVVELARSPTVSPAVDASQAPGDITFRQAMSPRDEAALIGQAVAQAVDSGTATHEIAVLLRSSEPMARLIDRDLRSRGIAVARPRALKVLDNPAVDAVCAAFSAFAAPSAPAWIELLSHPAFAIEPLIVRLALTATLPQSLEAVCTLLERLGVDAQVSVARLAGALRSAYGCWEHDDLLGAARYLSAHMELPASRSQSCVDAFCSALANICDIRAQLGDNTSATANYRAFLAESRFLRTAAATGDTAAGVQILDVHAAKGLEFTFVVIADAAENRFPNAWRPDQLLGSDDIEYARSCGVNLGTLADEHFAAERALWNVAITRTNRELLVTWSETGIDGLPQRAGRFVPLAIRMREAQRKSFRANLNDRSITIRELQAAVPARLMRPVAVSALETWFTCRRKFYYRELLGIGGSRRNFKAKLGTLVHNAIHCFHAVVHDFKTVELGAHEAWAARLRHCVSAIVQSADAPFDSALETSAAVRAAYRLVGRYAREVERTAREQNGFVVAASEQRVEFSLGGIDFAGRIDRIDRYADGTLALVDIKTGAFAKNKAMLDGFVKLGVAAANSAVWSKPPSRVNPQLALYRKAKSEVRSLEFMYLDAAAKADDYADAAQSDRFCCADEQPALAAIDTVLETTFLEPWASGAIASLDPTRFARTCRSCEFTAVCPGFLEDDEP